MHIKEGFAPLTPETTGGMENEGAIACLPNGPQSGRSPIRAALKAREDELVHNFR